LNLEFYEYIQKVGGFKMPDFSLPSPLIVVIEGGKHADNSTDCQEYLIAPKIKDSAGVISVKESVRSGAEVYLALKRVLQKAGYNTNVGNEGAYAPEGMRLNEEPWGLIMEAIENAGYKPGVDVMLAADLAASEFVKDVGDGGSQAQEERLYTQDAHSPEEHILQYQLKREQKVFSSSDFISYIEGWVEKYPFVLIEDPLAEDDWTAWASATKRLGGKVRVIGDDLLATNPTRLRMAIEEKACNGVLIKLNQIGTLSETIDTIKMAREAGFWTIVSHRGGGETNDTSMVDLAVASSSEMIKVGIARGERVCKYNRLMEIEEQVRG
jgi:enolase